MISLHVQPGHAPRVLAVFAFRYDAHLVPALISNIEPLVDGWVAYDDRASTGLVSNETQRQWALLNAAVAAGASWVLVVDPDERCEAALAAEVNRMTAAKGPLAYNFSLREMFSTEAYRVDGIWGRKRQARLLCVAHGLTLPPGDFGLPWSAFITAVRFADTTFNIYHLKMITRARREARAALYQRLDPGRHVQRFGYDYLADDTYMRLERIPPGREYFPRHLEDGGLWMGEIPAA